MSRGRRTIARPPTPSFGSLFTLLSALMNWLTGRPLVSLLVLSALAGPTRQHSAMTPSASAHQKFLHQSNFATKFAGIIFFRYIVPKTQNPENPMEVNRGPSPGYRSLG
jgi:hypothetical protein